VTNTEFGVANTEFGATNAEFGGTHSVQSSVVTRQNQERDATALCWSVGAGVGVTGAC